MWMDLKYAIRVLRHSRGFLVMAVITSAVAVAANTAVFSIVDAVLISPLGGVRDPAGLVLITRELRSNSYDNFSYPDHLDLRDQSQTLAGLAASCRTPLSFRSGEPLRLRAELVSGNYFSVLGVTPRLGRLILPEDDIVGGSEPVAALSFDLWQKQFGLDSTIVGKSIFLNGHSFTVIGVADRRFNGSSSLQATDIWVPIASQPQTIPRLSAGVLNNRDSKWLSLFGRLAPGNRINQANAEISVIGQQLDAEYPAANEGRLGVASGLGLDPDDRSSLQGFLMRLQAASVLLLVIASSNVAGLFLIRARSRQRELAIRRAVGASSGTLIRQFLIEGLLLAFGAAAMGLLLTPWLTRLIILITPPYYNLDNASAGYDLNVMLLSLVLALGMGAVFGLVPALGSSRRHLAQTLKDTAYSAGRGRTPIQDLLVVLQVGLSLLLVTGAGLILRSAQNIRRLDKGFIDRDLVISSIDLSIQGYSPQSGLKLYETVLDRIRSIPGVEAASLAKTVPPYDWSDRVSLFYEGEQPTEDEYRANWELGLRVDADRVAPEYFRTMGITLLAGRDFTA
jgi:predicted permease